MMFGGVFWVSVWGNVGEGDWGGIGCMAHEPGSIAIHPPRLGAENCRPDCRPRLSGAAMRDEGIGWGDCMALDGGMGSSRFGCSAWPKPLLRADLKPLGEPSPASAIWASQPLAPGRRPLTGSYAKSGKSARNPHTLKNLTVGRKKCLPYPNGPPIFGMLVRCSYGSGEMRRPGRPSLSRSNRRPDASANGIVGIS